MSYGQAKNSSQFESLAISLRDGRPALWLGDDAARPTQLHAANLSPAFSGAVDCGRRVGRAEQVAAVRAVWRREPVEREALIHEIEERRNAGLAVCAGGGQREGGLLAEELGDAVELLFCFVHRVHCAGIASGLRPSSCWIVSFFNSLSYFSRAFSQRTHDKFGIGGNDS